MASKILLVEDETGLATTLRDRLRKEGYAVSIAKTGTSGFQLATTEQFGLILLDVMLPDESDLTICQKLRQRGSATPVLMLTARRQLMDKVIGLKMGADDYLTKPFQMSELLARVEALLRRSGQGHSANSSRHRFGPFEMDINSTELFRDGKQIPLAAKEFQLLAYFVTHRDTTLSREELLREVWGYSGSELPSTRTVDVHIAWLRQKLGDDPENPQLIATVIGFGYKFAA